MRYELHYLQAGPRKTAHLVACHDEEAGLIAEVFLFSAQAEYGQLYSVRPCLTQKRRTPVRICWAEAPQTFFEKATLRMEV